MLGHELLEHVLLLLLLTCGQAELLLALIPHHLLHSLARLGIQVSQLGIFRHHLQSMMVLMQLSCITNPT